MKDIFKVAFALLFTWRSCRSSWDIFISDICHRDWLMNVYSPLWTHSWVLSPTFLFFPTRYSYFILLITLCINVWCVVNAFCVFFKAAIASGSAMLMAKSSPTNIKHSEFICVKWMRRGRKWGTILRCSFGWVDPVKKKKKKRVSPLSEDFSYVLQNLPAR